MCNVFGFKAELKKKVFVKFKSFFIVARADENPDNSQQVNYEELIKQARKEEKDKLYPRVTAAENKVSELTTSLNNALLEKAAVAKELEQMKANAQTVVNEEVTKLKNRIETLKTENKTLKESTPNEEEIRKKVEAEYEVKLYIQQKVSEVKDDVLSSFIPEITGATKEEVDKSVSAAKEKTLTIKKELGLVDEQGNALNAVKSNNPAVVSNNGLQQSFANVTNSFLNNNSPVKPPVAFPVTPTDRNNITLEQIRNLDPRSDEYKEFRRKMGLK